MAEGKHIRELKSFLNPQDSLRCAYKDQAAVILHPDQLPGSPAGHISKHYPEIRRGYYAHRYILIESADSYDLLLSVLINQGAKLTATQCHQSHTVQHFTITIQNLLKV
ncbi:hypothetical protein ACOME3_008431 [Neoechinorhynchus agilis]